MSLCVVFRCAARDELEEAAAWYEDRRRGLGEEFLNKIGEAIERATIHLDRYALVFNDARLTAQFCGTCRAPFTSDSATTLDALGPERTLRRAVTSAAAVAG